MEVYLDDVRREIRDADLLLFRFDPWSIFSRMISIAGRGAYSHAAMAGWWGDELMCLEMCVNGGRAVTLDSQARRYQIAVHSPDLTKNERRSVLSVMRRKVGENYNKWGVAKASLRYLPGVRLFMPFSNLARQSRETVVDPRRVEFCSEAYSNSIVAGTNGLKDPVPERLGCETLPMDLASTDFFTYKFTLVGETQPCIGSC